MRVLIAEDSVLLRAGLTRLLVDAGLDVIAAVGDAEELITAVERHEPDLAVVDVRMPPTNTDDGIRAALQIRDRWPDIGILVLSQYVEERYATDLLARDTRGVGYLLKERVGRVDAFVEALHRVAKGGTAIDPEVEAQLFAQRRADDPVERLTPREKEVLSVMAEGLGNQAIAQRLFITENAVHKHIRNIFLQLDLTPDDQTDRRVAAVLHYLERA